jgi:hypothetical protein
MVNRLLEIKAPVNEVLSNMVDCLTVTEWVRLDEMKNLLEPLTVQKNTLQTYSLPLICHPRSSRPTMSPATI